MHILHVAIGYKPAYRIGGPVLSVTAIAEMLVKKGHKVTVFATNSNFSEDLDVPTDTPVDVDGVEVWYFKHEEPLKKWLPFVPYLAKSVGYLYAPKMRAALEDVVPTVDVVHTHSPFVYPTYAAARVAAKCGKPVVYHQRGTLDPDHLAFRGFKKRTYLSLIEKPFVLQHAAMLIGLTEHEKESYRLLGLKAPCEVLPNGIDDLDYWQELPRVWHSRLGIDPGALVILFLGRLHPTKGACRLLQAFLQIQSKVPDALLVMAGPDEFGIQASLESQIADSALRDRIRFPGMVSGDEKRALLARADLFCLPSDGEGFSMAALEAMASKTAVLLSPNCHFPEVESAGAGVVVPPTPEKIADAMVGLLADRKLLARMGENGLDLVRREYDWDHLVDRLVEVYAKVLR